jgi:YVTN family beta-propeller protein
MTLEKPLIRRVVLLGAFAFGAFPVITNMEAAQTPSPALVIAIQGLGERAVQIADPGTMKVVGRVPLADNPHYVAVSADGKLAFVTVNNGGGRPGRAREEMDAPRDDYISVIDLVAQKELRRVKTGLGSFPHGIRVAGGKVYVTTEGYQSILRYDPARDQIDWRMGVGQTHPHGLAVNKDGKKIFTANEFAASVSAIEFLEPSEFKLVTTDIIKLLTLDPKSPWKVTTIPVGKQPEGIDISPDEKEVWVSNKHDGTVSIIDVATLKVSQTLTFNPKTVHGIELQFTPDGKRVVICTHYSGEVLVFDAATRKEIKRIQLGKPEHDYQIVYEVGGDRAFQNGVDMEPENGMQTLEIAPDGSHVYLTVSGSNRVAIIDLNTLKVTGSIPVGTGPEGIGWAERK